MHHRRANRAIITISSGLVVTGIVSFAWPLLITLPSLIKAAMSPRPPRSERDLPIGGSMGLPVNEESLTSPQGPGATPPFRAFRTGKPGTLDGELRSTDAPDSVRNTLATVRVRYRDFNGKERTGILVVRRDLTDEVKAIFESLYADHYPIAKIVSLDIYGWQGRFAREDNATYGFYWRVGAPMEEQRPSALGNQIVLNPYSNPPYDVTSQEGEGGRPPATEAGFITATGPVVQAFAKHGWQWMGTPSPNPQNWMPGRRMPFLFIKPTPANKGNGNIFPGPPVAPVQAKR